MSSPARSSSLMHDRESVLKLLAEAHVHHARVERTRPHAGVEPPRPRPGAGDRGGQHQILRDRQRHVPSQFVTRRATTRSYPRASPRIKLGDLCALPRGIASELACEQAGGGRRHAQGGARVQKQRAAFDARARPRRFAPSLRARPTRPARPCTAAKDPEVSPEMDRDAAARESTSRRSRRRPAALIRSPRESRGFAASSSRRLGGEARQLRGVIDGVFGHVAIGGPLAARRGEQPVGSMWTV